MVQPIQTLRSSTPGARPPAGKLEGELYVNIADKVIGVIDAAGAPIDLAGGGLGDRYDEYLPLVGGTMTGPLMLARDPLGPPEAATKQYVDAQVEAATQAISLDMGTF